MKPAQSDSSHRLLSSSSRFVVLAATQDDAIQRVFRAKVASAEADHEQELAELKRVADRERERLIREELNIPGFEKVLRPALGCSHPRTKAWGDKYGLGQRYSLIRRHPMMGPPQQYGGILLAHRNK